MPLSDTQVKNAKPREKAYKLTDGHGLSLYVTPTGAKSWRWKYRFDGREKQLVLGRYPEVGLREAREKRDEADRIRRGGRDPSFAKAEAAKRAEVDRLGTFEAVARAWHQANAPRWRDRHAAYVMRSLENDAFPFFGREPIGQIKPVTVLDAVRRVEQRGSPDQAHRLRQRLEAIFAMAIGMGLAETNPPAMIAKALAPVLTGRYPALRKIGDARAMLHSIEADPAYIIVKLASRFLALTAQRSEAVRFARWDEIEGDVWHIPAAHMKGRNNQRDDEAFDFLVPLPPQAVAVVEAARQINGNAPLIFGGVRDPRRPMSDSTLSMLYRRNVEWAGRHVPHGWRATFSTIMNEWAEREGKPGDRQVIDLMLAHKPSGVEARYNRAAFMPRRRELAAVWADILTEGLDPPEALLPS